MPSRSFFIARSSGVWWPLRLAIELYLGVTSLSCLGYKAPSYSYRMLYTLQLCIQQAVPSRHVCFVLCPKCECHACNVKVAYASYHENPPSMFDAHW
jgi:hypothetical protein